MNAYNYLDDLLHNGLDDSLEDEKLTTAGNLEKSTNNNMASSNNSGFYSGGLDDLILKNFDDKDYNLDLSRRVSVLEKRVQDQEDYIVCLKSTMADALRKIAELERMGNSPKGSTQHHGPFRATREVPGFFSTPLPSKPPVPSDSTRSRQKISPTTPETKRRTSSFNNSPQSGDKLGRKWGSTEHEICSIGKTPRKSSSLTNLSGQTVDRKVPAFRVKEPQFDPDENSVRLFLRGRPVTSYIPSSVENYNVKVKGAAPSKTLALDWVYGYRGKDSRFNLHQLPSGEVVYFMAAVVVLHNVEEGVQRHYLGHNDDVKSIAIHPDNVTIATGQVAGHDPEEGMPHVRIWNSVSLNTLHVIGLGVFDRAVCCIGFSKHDGGGHLGAIDDSNEHVLSVWDWAKEKKLCETKSSQDPVVQVEFPPQLENQLISLGKGHIHFWNYSTGKLVRKSGIFEKHDKPKFVLCMTFSAEGDVITGDSNGNIFIWGKGGTRIRQAVPGAHEGPIFSIINLSDGGFLSGGGKDKKIHSWNSSFENQGTADLPDETGPVRALCQANESLIFVGTTRNAILKGEIGGEFETVVQGHTDELWGLGINPNLGMFATGAHDKRLVVWDMESHKPLWSKTLEDPIQSVGFHPSGNFIAVGLQTGRWMVLDADTHDLVTVHTDGNEQHDIIRYSPDGSHLAVASHDNFIYIYAVEEEGRKYTKVGKCSGHSSFVTHIDWSADGKLLQSNSGDYEMLFWDTETCKQNVNGKDLRDTEWQTYTCVLGYPVIGIWPEGSDGTDVNTVARSHDGSIIATGDDFGKVKLFKSPASHPKTECNAYPGHSSHVTCVDFFPDDHTLISTGGRDMSVLQWKME
ncbi:77 kDa echinoderm microtubule-associated protein-like isoform X2 [Apostichopus japonicus]|uniref:77 kDa echinoderm microtubule-associated protein-like isoform X2 n=1 Tax=Stichopus japonicus TaxID=307972 RepID=UPI003AB4ADB2